MRRSPVPLITLLLGIIIGLLLDRRTQPEKASAKPEQPSPQQKSRTAEEMSPTYNTFRKTYLSKDYEPVASSPEKHERRFENVLNEFDLMNLTEMEAAQVKEALRNLFGSATFETRQLIDNYEIPEYGEKED